MRKEHRFISIFWILLCLLALFGCKTTETLSKPQDPATIADSTEILAIFSGLEETWNNKDVQGYKSYWLPGAKIITHRGEVHTMNHSYPDPSLQARMLGDKQKYECNPEDIKVVGDTATAKVKVQSKGWKLMLAYKLIKQDGKWLIAEQKAY
jgi:hypothetical protein